jgi:hypothetical protein
MDSAAPQAAHVQGVPIDLASLPQLDLIEVGEGALRVPFWGFGGVPFLPALRRIDQDVTTSRFIEAKSGEFCELYLFEDGTWRCVPASFSTVIASQLFYESEDCTQGRAYPGPFTCDGGQPPRGVIVQSTQGIACKGFPVLDAYAFGEKSSARSVSRLSGSCQHLFVSDDTNLLKLNEMNPAELFAPIERVLKD